jgi:hypothetical protein
MSGDRIKWRLPERLAVTLSDGREVTIEISQDGNTLVGTAHGATNAGSSGSTGVLNGSVEGDVVDFTVYCPGDSTVDFHGTFNVDGLATGTAVDRSGKAASEQWSAEPEAQPWE